MPRKTKEEAEKTYHELLVAAAELFTRRGVALTTLDDIARHAGVTRGAVYWHFKGKDEILRALMEAFAVPKLRPFHDKFSQISGEGAAQQFFDIIDEIFNLVLSDENVGQAIRLAIHNVEHTDNPSELQVFMREEAETFREAVTQAFVAISEDSGLKGEFNPELAAQGFLCLFFGMLDRHFHPYGFIDLSNGGREMVRGYMFGVLKSV